LSAAAIVDYAENRKQIGDQWTIRDTDSRAIDSSAARREGDWEGLGGGELKMQMQRRGSLSDMKITICISLFSGGATLSAYHPRLLETKE